MLKRLMTRIIRAAGLQFVRHTGQFDISPKRLRRLREMGVDFKMAIDGGAASGVWAEELKRVFPKAQVLCVEPRANAQGALGEVAKRLNGIHVARVLLGDKEGNVTFHEQEDQSSIMPPSQGNPLGVLKQERMTTLDLLVKKMELPDPDLIKLDLQGAELLCLKGAPRCLASAQFVIIEISLISIYDNSPVLADVVDFMNANGFRVYDILSLWHRPLDGTTTFGDFLFIKSGHEFVLDPRWSKRVKWDRSLFR